MADLDFTTLARSIVFDQAVSLGVQVQHPTFSLDDVYVVWFTYVLGNWKALCSTSLPDGRYYEVTYNGDFGFVDTYCKTHSVEFTIDGLIEMTTDDVAEIIPAKEAL